MRGGGLICLDQVSLRFTGQHRCRESEPPHYITLHYIQAWNKVVLRLESYTQRPIITNVSCAWQKCLHLCIGNSGLILDESSMHDMQQGLFQNEHTRFSKLTSTWHKLPVSILTSRRFNWLPLPFTRIFSFTSGYIICWASQLRTLITPYLFRAASQDCEVFPLQEKGFCSISVHKINMGSTSRQATDNKRTCLFISSCIYHWLYLEYDPAGAHEDPFAIPRRGQHLVLLLCRESGDPLHFFLLTNDE